MFKAHSCDVNVISWNRLNDRFLASGDDEGEVKVWDTRFLGKDPVS